jgi:hypothetical protein
MSATARSSGPTIIGFELWHTNMPQSFLVARSRRMHKPYRQAGGSFHITHVFTVNGGGAAKGAVGEINRRAVIQRGVGKQWHRLVIGIGDSADALAQIKPPGLWRDVGGGIS